MGLAYAKNVLKTRAFLRIPDQKLSVAAELLTIPPSRCRLLLV